MFELNSRDPRPIYEQIMEQLRKYLMTGVISENERLPSVRELSQTLTINPNTIQRAYRELENQGYIYSVPGKGSFAASQTDISEKRRTEIFGEFEKSSKELLFLGETAQSLSLKLQEWEKNNNQEEQV